MPMFGGVTSDYLLVLACISCTASPAILNHRSYSPLLRLLTALVQRDTIFEQLLRISFRPWQSSTILQLSSKKQFGS